MKDSSLSRQEVEAIVRLWQTRLGLDRWRIHVKWDEPSDDENAAQIRMCRHYDEADLSLSPDWATWKQEHGLRWVHELIAHELCHVLLNDLDEVLRSLETHLHRDVYAVARDRYKHELEGLVERLAWQFVELTGVE